MTQSAAASRAKGANGSKFRDGARTTLRPRNAPPSQSGRRMGVVSKRMERMRREDPAHRLLLRCGAARRGADDRLTFDPIHAPSAAERFRRFRAVLSLTP